MKKSDNTVLVTLEIENDLYFTMLQYCLDHRITIDECVNRALTEFIDKHKKSKKQPKKKA